MFVITYYSIVTQYLGALKQKHQIITLQLI